MSDTLQLDNRLLLSPPRSRRMIIAVTSVGLLLTTGTVMAAAYAGVTQDVRLPRWFGPWPWRPPDALHGWLVLGLVLIAGLCALWTWLTASVLRLPAARGAWQRLRLRTVALIAAVWALPFVLSGPVGSLDVQSYAAVGRLAAVGLDPYRMGPAALGDRFAAGVDPLWRATPTPYGPLQVQLLRAVALVAGRHVGPAVLLIRAVSILALGAALLFTVRVAEPAERLPALVLTALNPVVLVHIVSGAHLDALVGLLAVLAVACTRGGRPGLAMALAVVATALKLPGSVLVVFVLLDVVRRTPGPLRARALGPVLASGLAVSAAVVAICPDPFGWIRALGVPGIVRNGAAPSTWTAYAAGALTGHLSGSELDLSFTLGRTAMGMLGVGVVVTLLWRATSGSTRQAFRGVGWALIALALTGPAFYPWYLAWGLFATAVGSGARGRYAVVGLSAASCVAAALGQGWVVFAVWSVLLVGTVWFWLGTGRDHLARRSTVEKSLPDTADATVVPVWM
jgi:alpha-1,6-mannosyltransferase